MHWLKQNPLFSLLAAAAVAVIGIGGFYVSSESSRLDEERAAFEQKTAQLQQLERNKPFPEQANIDAARKEAEAARAEFDALAGMLAVSAPSVSPQDFNDELAKLVKDAIEKAAAKGVALPQNFYLGFEEFEKQLPDAKMAPKLALLLRAIHAVVSAAIQSGVKSIDGIFRAPLASEATPAAGQKAKVPPGGQIAGASSLEFAPFEIAFVADQSAFRLAFNRIVELEPPVFVRLVATENSAPLAPSKTAPPGQSAANSSPELTAGSVGTNASGIRVLLGRETLTVNLRLATVVSSEVPPSTAP